MASCEASVGTLTVGRAGTYAAAVLTADRAGEVADRFGLGGRAVLAGPVARGEMGLVWRLTTSRGSWALKEPFDPPAPEAAEDVAAFQEAARAAGVPAPAVVRTVEGHVTAPVGASTVLVYEWVDMEGPDRYLDPGAVGRLLAAIHQVGHRGAAPVHPWYHEAVGAARWDQLIGELGAAGAPFAVALAAQRDELVALEGLLEPPTRLLACHRDLFADNVRRDSGGSDDGDRLWVIDWDNSGLADPGQELAVALFEYGGGNAGRTRSLYRSYLEAGGPGRVCRPGDFSMAIAQFGHIGERAARLWLDPGHPGDRARHAMRVGEFLGDPLTRRAIDDLLASTTGSRG